MTINEKLDLLLNKFEKIDAIENTVYSLNNKFNTLEGRFDALECRFDALECRVNTLEKDIQNIKVILENEIRVNIQRIAEGHLDLSRNLKQAQKSNEEVENLALKVTVLQTDVKELKQKIS